MSDEGRELNPMRCNRCGISYDDRQPGSTCAKCHFELEQAATREQRLDDDRAMLLKLMAAFDLEVWNCPKCGHAESTSDCDSAITLREYLSKAHRDRSAPPPDVVLPPLPERDWTPDGINSLWSLNSMRAYARAAVELNRPSAPSGAIPAGYVKIPESVPEAEAMILAANAWLESVAPEGKV